MNYFSKLIVMLTIICHSQCYSQKISKERKEHHRRLKENSKGLSLKINDLKTVEKNGKTSWTVKSTLTNHSRDTLFYFGYPDCEASGFIVYTVVDTVQSYIDLDFKKCDGGRKDPTVIALPPKGQQTFNLEIISKKPVTFSFKFMMFLSTFKAKNMNDRNPNYDLMRKEGNRQIWLQSNKIKT